MIDWIFWALAILAALFCLDRVLLWFESRGWMYYRRNKPRGGAALYHLMQIHSIFEPGFEEVIEVKVHEEQAEDESGAPPGSSDREGRANEDRPDG